MERCRHADPLEETVCVESVDEDEPRFPSQSLQRRRLPSYSMKLDIVNVEHGACAFIVPPASGRLAMVDCGHNETKNWRPSTHIRYGLGRKTLDYLFITNADHDHYSDLHDLVRIVDVHWFHRGWFTSEQFLAMKRGPLSDDARSYDTLNRSHVYPSALVLPFDEGMDGITHMSFSNTYGVFTDTNNLSVATFFSYNGFQVLFPGDLEEEGWQELLKNAAFREQLGATTILVASHHGRFDGFCAEVFNYCDPLAVVISDKEILHDTQEGMAALYGSMLNRDGVVVKNSLARRKVLTTRSDGNIRFDVTDGSHFDVLLHYGE